jgi:hypothetical protein
MSPETLHDLKSDSDPWLQSALTRRRLCRASQDCGTPVLRLFTPGEMGGERNLYLVIAVRELERRDDARIPLA